jgi:hypothetical protein
VFGSDRPLRKRWNPPALRPSKKSKCTIVAELGETVAPLSPQPTPGAAGSLELRVECCLCLPLGNRIFRTP